MCGIASFLNKSIYNIWQGDSYVNYSSYQSPYFNENAKTTAFWEIFESISWMGEKAKYILSDLHHLEGNLSEFLNQDNKKRLVNCIQKLEALDDPEDDCCIIPTEIYGKADEKDVLQKEINLSDIILEDQDGVTTTWDVFFKGKYTVLSFFYSRCHNPRKCIQTIYNLVDIQKSLKDFPELKGVQTAAITYDPEYDKSPILKAYGNNRLFNFDEHNKMFRVAEGMEKLIDQLNIGVNYKGDNVNVHRIEVYIINPEGKIEKSFLRFQAKSDVIIIELEQLHNPTISKKIEDESSSRKSSIMNRLSTVILPFLIAFFPKCPICWASYIHLLGLGGLVSIKYQLWLIYVFVGLAIFNLFNLYRLAKKRNGKLPFYLASIGTIILTFKFWLDLGNVFVILGFVFTLSATLLNSLSFKEYHQLMLFFNEKKIIIKFNN